MGKAIDLTGQRFGRLTVVKKTGKSVSRDSLWLCRCECGNTHTVRAPDLKSGKTRSCGCLHKEQLSQRSRTHGERRSKLYIIWGGMKQRCYQEKSISFPYYGGRGISVCEEWRNSFQAFREWSLNNGYEEGLSIDRINVNGNYEPSNCRWVLKTEQSKNRQSNRYLSFSGKTQTLSDWAIETNQSPSCLYQRLRRGWSVEDALTVPVGQKRPKH